MSGNSGGGVLTAYTAAIDERIRVAIPSCSFTSMTGSQGYIFHCDCCMVPGLRNWGDWPELGGLIAPRRLLLVHGVKDGLHHSVCILEGTMDMQLLGYSPKNLNHTTFGHQRIEMHGLHLTFKQCWRVLSKAGAKDTCCSQPTCPSRTAHA